MVFSVTAQHLAACSFLINAVLTSAMCYLARWVWVSGGMLVSAASLAMRRFNILYSPADTC